TRRGGTARWGLCALRMMRCRWSRGLTGTGGLERHVLGSQRFNLAPIRLPSTYRHSRFSGRVIHPVPSLTVPVSVAGGERDGGGRIRVVFQNPAHRGIVVFGGRAARRMVEKGLQVAFEGDEFGDLRADLVEPGVQDVSDVPARHLAAVVDRQDLAHLL